MSYNIIFGSDSGSQEIKKSFPQIIELENKGLSLGCEIEVIQIDYPQEIRTLYSWYNRYAQEAALQSPTHVKLTLKLRADLPLAISTIIRSLDLGEPRSLSSSGFMRNVHRGRLSGFEANVEASFWLDDRRGKLTHSLIYMYPEADDTPQQCELLAA